MKLLDKFTEIGFDEEMSYNEKQRTVVFNYLNLVMFLFSAVRFVYVVVTPVMHYSMAVKLINAVPIVLSFVFTLMVLLKKQKLALGLGILVIPPMVVMVSYYTMDTAVQLILLILPVLSFYFLNQFKYILLSFLYVAFWFASLFIVKNNIFHEAILNSPDQPLTVINCTGALFILFFTLYAVKYQVWSFEKYILKKNQELRTLNNVKDKIFAIVSHDMQSPLIGLDRLFTYLLNTNYDANEVKKMIPEISVEVNNTLGILTNLLNWSKTQLLEIKSVPSYINLKHSAIQNTRQLQGLAAVKKVQIVNEVKDKVTAYADGEMITIILRNLTMNAIKYSYSNSQVFIYARQQGNKAVIGVADKGKGIPKGKQSSLLETFSHATKGTDNEQGFGLGLMICRELVEMNNGTIHFESVEGEGSNFWIELPATNVVAKSGTLNSSVKKEEPSLAAIMNFV